MAELLSYAETQKLLDELPREQQKLVADMIPAQISVGGVQRVLQKLLAERVSIRDLPTILEGIQEACAGGAATFPPSPATCARGWRGRSATRMSATAATSRWSPCAGMGGGVRRMRWSARPRTASSRWRRASSANSCRRSGRCSTAPRQAGEAPVLLTSGGIRFHVRAIVERIRPATPVLAQAEIYPRVRIRTVGTI